MAEKSRPGARRQAAAQRAKQPPCRTQNRWRLLRENALSLVLIALFVLMLAGQSVAGYYNFNEEQSDHNEQPVSYRHYLTTGSFVESVGENWESEFLQMFAYVLLTVFLVQKGSSEPRDPDKEEAVDEDPRSKADDPDAPWPVRRGGWVLKLYENSLALAFLPALSRRAHPARARRRRRIQCRTGGARRTPDCTVGLPVDTALLV